MLFCSFLAALVLTFGVGVNCILVILFSIRALRCGRLGAQKGFVSLRPNLGGDCLALSSLLITRNGFRRSAILIETNSLALALPPPSTPQPRRRVFQPRGCFPLFFFAVVTNLRACFLARVSLVVPSSCLERF